MADRFNQVERVPTRDHRVDDDEVGVDAGAVVGYLKRVPQVVDIGETLLPEKSLDALSARFHTVHYEEPGIN